MRGEWLMEDDARDCGSFGRSLMDGELLAERLLKESKGAPAACGILP
jgi:hypothetical protein